MILEDILLQKHIQLANNSYLFDIAKIIETFQQVKTESFYQVIAKRELSIIGEIKKKMPRGNPIANFDPVRMALKYDWAVDAISVVTEEFYFAGRPDFINTVHQATDTPILWKDYVISPIQIFQAKEFGASAVHLIVSILDKTELREYIRLIHGLKMDALVEAASEDDIEIALSCGAKMISINNSNLVDFMEDLDITVRLSKYVPKDILLVSDGGIYRKEDIERLAGTNVRAVFVNEYFLQSDDVVQKANEYKKALRKK